ncbi:hypothetical protein VVR12_08740 [Rothia sp. LK2588]|uniref:hypothetical protein n=1 Tax=Rothia sp. LK2588 TaxID=3114369 RepID=UPI0034CDCA1C
MATPPPYEHNDARYNAPNDTQAINMGGYNRDHGGTFAPGQHPVLKKLLKLTLISATIYLLMMLVQAFFTDNVALSAWAKTDSETIKTSAVIGNIVGMLIVAALYALVYKLLAKGKNAGRITGIVFCILGTIGAALGLLNIFSEYWFLAIFSAALLVVNIMWLVTAFKPEVRHNLV